MNSKNYGLTGVGGSVELSKGGALIKNNAGVVEHRNNADAAFAVVRGAAPVADNDLVTLEYLERYVAEHNATNVIGYYNATDFHAAASGAADGAVAIVTAAGGTDVVNPAGGTIAVGEEDLIIYRGDVAAWEMLFDSSVDTIDPAWNGYTISIPVAIADNGYTYSADHLYMWNGEGTTWVDIGPAASVTNVSKDRSVALAFGTASPVNIGAAIPDNATIKRVAIYVATGFDGTAPTVTIGTAGTPAQLMSAAENNLKVAGVYVSECHVEMTADTQYIATYVADGSTVGSAAIVIDFTTDSAVL